MISKNLLSMFNRSSSYREVELKASVVANNRLSEIRNLNFLVPNSEIEYYKNSFFPRNM